jgi:hypothetical protein
MHCLLLPSFNGARWEFQEILEPDLLGTAEEVAKLLDQLDN